MQDFNVVGLSVSQSINVMVSGTRINAINVSPPDLDLISTIGPALLTRMDGEPAGSSIFIVPVFHKFAIDIEKHVIPVVFYLTHFHGHLSDT